MEGVVQVIESISNGLGENLGSISVVMGMVWLAVSKFVPNSKAGPIVAGVQKGADLLAKGLLALGGLVQKASHLLSEVVKSDGILGRK